MTIGPLARRIPKRALAPSAPPRKVPCVSPAAMHAPVNPPMTMRAISPGGAVRLGVCGSLSATSSSIASRVKIATPGTEPMRENGRSHFDQPKYTAHAVAAGAVSERNPPTIQSETQKEVSL